MLWLYANKYLLGILLPILQFQRKLWYIMTKQYLKRPGETIYFQGESADRLYLVKKGRVRVFYVTKAGKELTFEVIEKGKLIGESSFLSHSVYPVSAAAVNQVELLECDLHGLYAYMEESPQLMYVIIQLLSRTCNHLTEQLRRITLYDRYQKIASFLLHETAYPDRDRGVTDDEIPYTHEELALSLGMNRVTVSKVLSQWKQEGILSAGYGQISGGSFEKTALKNIGKCSRILLTCS